MTLRSSLALALSLTNVLVIMSTVLAALSKRDSEYGLSLSWVGIMALLSVVAMGVVLVAVGVAVYGDPVTDIWKVLPEAAIAEVWATTVFRRTDPRG
jgi:hypothetical protein